MTYSVEEEQVMQTVVDDKNGRGRGRGAFQGRGRGRQNTTRTKSNVSNAINLDIFNMNVVCGTKKRKLCRNGGRT